MATTARVVLMTAPDAEVGRDLARAAVEAGLAACVNLVPGVTSIYRWEGEVQEDSEVLLVCKTTRERVEELRTALMEAHPYDVPEFVVLDATRVHPPYLAWLGDSTARS